MMKEVIAVVLQVMKWDIHPDKAYEFADMATWAAWQSNKESQKVLTELHTLALNVTTELWGPSPVVPAPIRPGK